MKLINKREFAKTALEKNSENFVMHIAALKVPLSDMTIHFSQIAQVQVAALQENKTQTKISSGYTDYADVFSLNLAMELPKNTDVNKHVIKFIKNKQSS